MDLQGLTIFTFHAIEAGPDVIALAPPLLERLLRRLHHARWHCLSLLDAASYLREKRPLPARAFVLTFDDGYASVYEHAFPLIQELGMTATVFVAPGLPGGGQAAPQPPSIGGRAMLRWEQIQEMQRHGVDIGAHTLTHPELTRLDGAAQRHEIEHSQELLQQRLGTPVRTFAYPFGQYDARSRAVAAARFACACSDRLGIVKPTEDLFTLGRVDSYYLQSPWLCEQVTSPFFPAYIQARAIPRQARRRWNSMRAG